MALAADLGSDVPFTVVGGAALATGRGEIVQPIAGVPQYHWVLALPFGQLSTRTVYETSDKEARPGLSDHPPVDAAVVDVARSGDPAAFGETLVNSLHPTVFRLYDGLAGLLGFAESHGAVAGIVSGTGPTCAILALDANHATQLARELARSNLCRHASVVTGPVAGPEIVDGPPSV
jgi:4-diphosphocytidyl-2-C-methyl-D-erythritol kinase